MFQDLQSEVNVQAENLAPVLDSSLPANELQSLGMLLGLSAVSFAVVLVVSALRRMIAGASPFKLVAGGAYEWVPFRGLLISLYGLMCITQIGLTLMMILFAWAFAWSFVEKPESHWQAPPFVLVTACGIGLAVTHWLRKLLAKHAIYVGMPAPPKVKVTVGAISHLRDAGETYWIGTERFPNASSPYFSIGVNVRRVLLLVGVVALLLQALVAVGPESFAKSESQTLKSIAPIAEQLRTSYTSVVMRIRQEDMSKPMALSVAYFSFVLLWIVLRNNRQYLVMRFAPAALLSMFLAATIWVSLVGLESNNGPSAGMRIPFASGLVLLGLLDWRLFSDLRAASKHKRKQQLFRPIRDTIASATSGFLSQVQSDPACRLPDLNKQELSERVTKGAHNIEEGDTFVTRFFGRYMRVANIATERCTTAAMRFLTINRYTILGGGWPTHAPLSNPKVPVWNESLFPINAPKHFVNRRDELCLPDRWNCVVYCPPTEQVQESYTEYETRYEWDSSTNSNVSRTVMVTKTRYVTVTCSKCRGTGRLEHHQILVTTWQTHSPNEVSPEMSMPEMVDGAEEAYYFQLPLVDQMKRLPARYAMVKLATPLADKMTKAAELCAREYDRHATSILKASGDAYVYRSDFVIGGLYAMNVRFSHLRSRSGWFFGTRPEFHFPKLPLGWATLGTWLFLPPLTIATWLVAISLLFSGGRQMFHELKPKTVQHSAQAVEKPQSD